MCSAPTREVCISIQKVCLFCGDYLLQASNKALPKSEGLESRQKSQLFSQVSLNSKGLGSGLVAMCVTKCEHLFGLQEVVEVKL